MVMLRHALSGTEYYRNEDGTVRVVGRNGVEGLFTRKGDWISGERRTADRAMCVWISDGNLPSMLAVRAKLHTQDTTPQSAS